MFVCLLVGAGLLIVDSYTTTGVDHATASASVAPTTAPATNNSTVIASQRGRLYGYAPDGSLLFEDNKYDAYWDVDPSPAGNATVLYSASNEIPKSQCGATPCVRDVVERYNITTGERTRLFSRLIPDRGGQVRWHDVDRINATRYVVAGIAHDRVFVFDSESDEITWQWDAQTAYNITSGNSFPGDWTHLNDVEVLPDGRIMASLRNLDKVVFIEPGEGVQKNWTLGVNGDHSILYEQHNPDYIPTSRGGPAVVVADSQNNRVVEYQRVNGSWERTWTWRDSLLQWPRDADRLSNGNTLVTDSNGDRVLEVDESGEVVWSVAARLPYEAERIDFGDTSTANGTIGDESDRGESAAALGLDSRTTPDNGTKGSTSAAHRLWVAVKTTAPALPLNAVLYVLPDWIHPVNVVPMALAVVATLGLFVTELVWSRRVRSWLRRTRSRLPW